MKILAIDTSAKTASAALAEDDVILGSFFLNTGLTHSQTLIPMVDELLKNSHIGIKDIDAIAVNSGPGSFTGVRIGVAAAKGLAFADNIKCVSVSTLESMAYNMQENNCIVCAVMDARRSQFYNALFRCHDGKIDRLCNDRAISFDELENEINNYSETVYVVGDGAQIFMNMVGSTLSNVFLAPLNQRMQCATSVARAALMLVNQGKTLSPEQLMPTYLRLPQAERELNKKPEVK